jgi:hypothetical protein
MSWVKVPLVAIAVSLRNQSSWDALEICKAIAGVEKVMSNAIIERDLSHNTHSPFGYISASKIDRDQLVIYAMRM